MDEARTLLARPFEEHVRAENIGVDELVSTDDRTVDMRLGREVHADAAALAGPRNHIGVGDIALDELVRDTVEIGGVAGVGQLVEDDNLVTARDQPLDEVTTNESATACYKHSHAFILVPQIRLQWRTMIPSLGEKIAVVTGASSGIGQACAEFLVDSGAVVYPIDLAGPNPVDVTDRAALDEVADRVSAEHGRLDILISAAGVLTENRPVDEIPVDDFRRTFEVNLLGTVQGCQAFAPLLKSAKGAVVNVASQAALVSLPQQAAYSASKAGVAALTRSIAIDWAADGVRRELRVSRLRPHRHDRDVSRERDVFGSRAKPDPARANLRGKRDRQRHLLSSRARSPAQSRVRHSRSTAVGQPASRRFPGSRLAPTARSTGHAPRVRARQSRRPSRQWGISGASERSLRSTE